MVVGYRSCSPGTDPCSSTCAVQLAVGVRSLMGADVAVSTIGVGGPTPRTATNPGPFTSAGPRRPPVDTAC